MIFGHYSESHGVFGFVFVSVTGKGQDDQHPELHPGVTVSQRTFPVQLWLWLTISTNFNINNYCTLSTHTKSQGWISTQIEECDLPLCVCACASHASRGPNKESSCTSVPHGTRTVCNGGIVFYSSCDGPEVVGKSQDCHCSLQNVHVVWDCVAFVKVSLSTRYLTLIVCNSWIL